jgi:DNA-binding transcriptional regulator LsrR (DeoR family)
MRAVRISAPESDREDYETIVTAARRFYVEGLTQERVARELGLSQSSVSRLLERARREGIVKAHIEPPRLLKLEAELRDQLAVRGIHTVHIVPGGGGKNTENLGLAGARTLATLLSEVQESTIRMAMSCGDTLLAVVENFLNLLAMDAELARCLRQKKLELYPSALYADSRLEACYPHTIVSILAIMMKRRDDTLDIEAHIPSLPPDFYTKLAPEEMESYSSRYHIKDMMEYAKQSKIFLLGIGDLKNKTYDRIQEQLGIHINKDKFVSESNYIPICKDGTQHKEIEDKLIAIKIDDFRRIAKQQDCYVVAIAGGEHKREAIEAALAKPYFNVLVTDERVARYLLDRR